MSESRKTYNLTQEDKTELQRRVNSPKASQRDSLRANIILLRASGMTQRDVAKKMGTSHATVSKWTMRFEQDGIDGLNDAPGRGRKPSIEKEKQKEILDKAVKPPEGTTRWSTRKMAEHVGVSHMTVQRLWSSNDIKPHRTKTFKLSNDMNFEEKFWDVIGLYMDPPDNAIVLCCDEKSQCQALERTQPQLPLGMGHINTKTHDYIRHGTVTLFTALDYLKGTLISRVEKRHTHKEWLRFLKQINRETPKDLEIHVIADNYCTHKQADVKKWLEKHPRFHMHFVPTSCSWLNLVERFFADITNECIRDGSFTSVPQLTRSIMAYINRRSENPKPYVWRADGKVILEKITRARKALEKQ
jgi:transposase